MFNGGGDPLKPPFAGATADATQPNNHPDRKSFLSLAH